MEPHIPIRFVCARVPFGLNHSQLYVNSISIEQTTMLEPVKTLYYTKKLAVNLSDCAFFLLPGTWVKTI